MRLTVRPKRHGADMVEAKAPEGCPHSKTLRELQPVRDLRQPLECAQPSAAFALWFLMLLLSFGLARGDNPSGPEIRTPPAPATPRINGPGIFGVRPNHPFLYTIPATGERPMTFSL